MPPVRVFVFVMLAAALARADDAAQWRDRIVEAHGLIGTGQYRQAEQLLQQTIRAIEAKEPRSPMMAAALNNMGLVYEALGDALKAERSFMRAIAILKSCDDVTDRDRARPMNNLGILYLELGVIDKLRELRLDELADRLEKLNPNYPDLAITLENVAGYHYIRKKLSLAEESYRKAMALRTAHEGPEGFELASNFHNLGALLIQQKRYAEAEQHLQRAFSIWEKHPDRFNPSKPLAYANLGWVYALTGRRDQAESTYAKAIQLAESLLGKEHQKTAEVLENYAGALKLMERKSEARQIQARSNAIREQGRAQRLGLAVDVSEASVFPGRRY